MSRFKYNVGDRVRFGMATGEYFTGRISCIAQLPFVDGVEYGVVVNPEFNYNGHDCGGVSIIAGVYPEGGRSIWVEEKFLERVNTYPTIVISTNGKVTKAQAKFGHETVAVVETSCHPDDEFDYASGAKIVIDRLFSTDKKKAEKNVKAKETKSKSSDMNRGKRVNCAIDNFECSLSENDLMRLITSIIDDLFEGN